MRILNAPFLLNNPRLTLICCWAGAIISGALLSFIIANHTISEISKQNIVENLTIISIFSTISNILFSRVIILLRIFSLKNTIIVFMVLTIASLAIYALLSWSGHRNLFWISFPITAAIFYIISYTLVTMISSVRSGDKIE